MDTTALLTLQNAETARADAAMTRAVNATGSGKSNAKLGEEFESMVLSQLLAPMFEGLETDGPFGGGHGEEAMRSFYIGAMAEQMAKRGGVGISTMMQKELLKLQGAA
jgi:Rod binding domain-containing protein